MDTARSLLVLLALSFVAAASVGASGCAGPISGVITSAQPRIWVVRNGTQVYRCAEASDTGVPQAVCVQAEYRRE